MRAGGEAHPDQTGGERLRFHAARILETAALAVRELDPQRTSPPLRIGAFSTANATIVPAVLARLATAHPELSVTVRENRSVGLFRGLVSGSLDVAVVSDYPASPPSQASIRLERVTDDPFIVALPIRHPLLGGRFSLRDLASSPWIEGDRAETPVLVAAAANAGFEPYIAHRVRDWHTKLAYVATGLGCALVPGLAAAWSRPDVAFRRLSGELPERRVSLAMSTTSAADDAALDAFSAAVRGVVREVAQRVRSAG